MALGIKCICKGVDDFAVVQIFMSGFHQNALPYLVVLSVRAFRLRTLSFIFRQDDSVLFPLDLATWTLALLTQSNRLTVDTVRVTVLLMVVCRS